MFVTSHTRHSSELFMAKQQPNSNELKTQRKINL